MRTFQDLRHHPVGLSEQQQDPLLCGPSQLPTTHRRFGYPDWDRRDCYSGRTKNKEKICWCPLKNKLVSKIYDLFFWRKQRFCFFSKNSTFHFQLFDEFNSNARQRGRVLQFQSLQYGYMRVEPQVGVDYVLDMILWWGYFPILWMQVYLVTRWKEKENRG